MVGRGLTTALSKSPKLTKFVEFTTRPGFMLTGVGAVGVEGATGITGSTINYAKTGEFELGGGWKFGKQTGMNPFETALIGGATDIGKIYAFTAGATAGEIPPIKIQKFDVKRELTTRENVIQLYLETNH